MYRLLAFLCFLFVGASLNAQSETDYSAAIAAHWGARTEVPVTSGRVDILTEQYAIEVEWANKWKDGIGQALWYGLQTNRAAGIILIVRSSGDYKYFLQLNSALRHADLQDRIRVWQYPKDFPGVDVNAPLRTVPETDNSATGSYWLSTNSNKRHRSSCRWYAKSKGRYCTATEGTPAGCCYR